MSLLDYEMIKKLLQAQVKTNELLQTLIDLQQPKAEVVSDKPVTPKTRKPRGSRNGNQK